MTMRRRDLFLAGAASIAFSPIPAKAFIFGRNSGGGLPGSAAPIAGTLQMVNNTGGTLTNQLIKLGMSSKAGLINPSLARFAFRNAADNSVIASQTGSYGQWGGDGSQASCKAALFFPSLPAGTMTVNIVTAFGAEPAVLPGGKTLAQIKAAVQTAAPNGDVEILLSNFFDHTGAVQGSGSYHTRLSDWLANPDLSVTYQGLYDIEFRARGNFVTDVVGGAAHGFVQAIAYFGAQLDPVTGNVLAVYWSPIMHNGSTATSGQTCYSYDCQVRDGVGNVLFDYHKSATFTDANLTSIFGKQCQITITNHPFQNASPIWFSSTGTLPSPLVPFPNSWYTDFGGTGQSNVSTGPNFADVFDANTIGVAGRCMDCSGAGNVGPAFALTGSSPSATHTVFQRVWHPAGSSWFVRDQRGHYFWSTKSPVATITVGGVQVSNVEVVHDPDYCIKTKMFPPVDLTIISSQPTPDAAGTGAQVSWLDRYVPGGTGSRIPTDVNGVGDHPSIGLMPAWVPMWMLTKNSKWKDSMRICALYYAHAQQNWIDASSSVIPSVLSVGLTPAGMTRTTVSSTSIAWTGPLNNTGGRIVDKTIAFTRTGNDGSHLGDYGPPVYWLEGDTAIRDSMIHAWHGPLFNYTPGLESSDFTLQTFNRDKQVNGVNFTGVASGYWGNHRATGWMTRNLAHLLLSFDQSSLEYQYCKAVSDNDAAYHAARKVAHDAAGSGWSTQGAWIELASFGSAFASILSFHHMYCFYGVHEMAKANPSANWVTMREHIADHYRSYGGSGVPIVYLGGGLINVSPTCKTPPNKLTGFNTTSTDKRAANDPGANWSAVHPPSTIAAFQNPSLLFNSDNTVTVDFLAVGSATGIEPIDILNAATGFRFTGGINGTADSPTASPPAGILFDTDYVFIASTIDLVNRKAQIALAASPTTQVTWTLASNGQYPGILWKYPAGVVKQTATGFSLIADFATGYQQTADSVFRLAVADGLTGFDAALADTTTLFQRDQLNGKFSTSANAKFAFRSFR